MGIRFYWYALAAFLGGIGLDAVYGVIQLVLAEGGVNLDEVLIQPITSRQTGINVFGAVGGTQEVFRPNALTGDPTTSESSSSIPLLVLTPLYLRLEPGHRLKTPLAVSLAFLLVVELATLSRSALLGTRLRCVDPRSSRTAATCVDPPSSCRWRPSRSSSRASSSFGSTSS